MQLLRIICYIYVSYNIYYILYIIYTLFTLYRERDCLVLILNEFFIFICHLLLFVDQLKYYRKILLKITFNINLFSYLSILIFLIPIVPMDNLVECYFKIQYRELFAMFCISDFHNIWFHQFFINFRYTRLYNILKIALYDDYITSLVIGKYMYIVQFKCFVKSNLFFSFTDFSSGKLWSCVSVFVLGPILSRSLHLLHHCMKLCNQGYIYYMEQNQTELLHHYLDVINYINICYIFS